MSLSASTVLAVNVGSSSIKMSLFRSTERIDVYVNFIGLKTQIVKVIYRTEYFDSEDKFNVVVGNDFSRASSLVVNKLKEVLLRLGWPTPRKIGHRVKFAGVGPTVQEFTNHLENVLAFNDYLSSRHNALCLAVIHEAKKAFPGALQFLVRDHAIGGLSLHREEQIPFSKTLIKRYGLYSNGYHGLAIKACLKELKSKYGISNYTGLICQVGSGVSVSAVVDGTVKSNTMQFAACDGPVMHNRSGTQPMGLVLRMLKYGFDPNFLSHMFNTESGIYGLASLPPNSDVTVEQILGDERLARVKDAYLTSCAVEIFKAVSLMPKCSSFVFSGGLATKHKWLGPELLYRSKNINLHSKLKVISQLGKDNACKINEDGKSIMIVEVDEQIQIVEELTAQCNKQTFFDFSPGVCEVPGSSFGRVKIGFKGWGEGMISLNYTDTSFEFNMDKLPEAFIFSGGDRREFFLRSVFARLARVPTFFIKATDFDISTIVDKNVFLDTPGKIGVEL